MGRYYHYPGADDPETYEWENRIADPEQRIEAFMASVAPWTGQTLVDIGSGSAFHAARFAQTAARVLAVEPSPAMLAQAFRRLAAEPRGNLSLVAADAEDVPLRDGLANVIHSRFAYFFGPESDNVASCEPGIAEAMRLLKPGGVFFVIDNDVSGGDFAQLIGMSYPRYPVGEAAQARMTDFWRGQGFEFESVNSCWRAPDRDILRRVLGMEFPAERVDELLEQVNGVELSYQYAVYWRVKAG